MFAKALVATDLSEACAQVVRCATALDALGTSDIELIQCLNLRDVGTLAPRLMELSRPALLTQAEVLERAGFNVTAEIVTGLPQIETVRQAIERHCDFIVAGSHGQSMSRAMLLGGVAAGIVHNSSMPVLLVRLRVSEVHGKEVCEVPRCDFLTHVLFVTDFSENAAHAFEYVRELARRGAGRITLLHVQDKGRLERHTRERLDEFNRIDSERLSALKDELRAAGDPEVSIELPFGSPKQEIVIRTESEDVSLVVIGRQGRGWIPGLQGGSVSDAVARHSAAPVLIVPPPDGPVSEHASRE